VLPPSGDLSSSRHISLGDRKTTLAWRHSSSLRHRLQSQIFHIREFSPGTRFATAETGLTFKLLGTALTLACSLPGEERQTPFGCRNTS
jgi:hypothetical protein